MSAWEELVTAALVGTEHANRPLPAGNGRLDALLARLSAGEPEARLALALAAAAPWARAGRRPPEASGAPPEPCAAEERPAASARAAASLALILQGPYRGALAEWLAVVAGRGRRVPAESLPALLALGRGDSSLREAIRPALGARGSWLAQQNPEWEWAVGGEGTWLTGPLAARAAFLRELRRSDPAAAREQLAATWEAEGPEARAALLEALSVGLEAADEAFLEAALDDRRKEVRKTAADLLARWPGSALCARMAERARPLLSIERDQAVGWRIEATFPAACDAAMIRDGIEPKRPAGQQLGERAWWLRQLVAAVPPAAWCAFWGRPVAELAALFAWSEAGTGLFEAVSTAAARQADLEWVEALLLARLPRDETSPLLVEALPPARRDAVALRLFETHRGDPREEHPGGVVLAMTPHRWSGAVSRIVLERLQRGLRSCSPGELAASPLRGLLKQYAYRMDPSVAGAAATGWPAWPPEAAFWPESVAEFLQVLEFRREMLEELEA